MEKINIFLLYGGNYSFLFTSFFDPKIIEANIVQLIRIMKFEEKKSIIKRKGFVTEYAFAIE